MHVGHVEAIGERVSLVPHFVGSSLRRMSLSLPCRSSASRNDLDSHPITNPLHASSNPSRLSSSVSSSTSSPSSVSTSGTSDTLFLTRFSSPSPIKPILYPYTSTNRLSSTLRPRGRISHGLAQLARGRIVHLILALSIPLLVLALVQEIQVHARHRTLAVSTRDFELESLDDQVVDLALLRSKYEKKRRRALGEDENTVSTYEQEERLQREVGDVWPEWWGNIDKVGHSPFDHIPGPIEGQRRRVLFLTSTSALSD